MAVVPCKRYSVSSIIRADGATVPSTTVESGLNGQLFKSKGGFPDLAFGEDFDAM